ncbi:trna pseudouridine synthase b [Ligilactobacillus hayakitensis DSM 18933 = JCM 14209]|uniref:tRNA pseudouridine synthase B n=1 Tax=Ligilactobacillus hayakitensis DSM 18933 = JCM 14209 TaxID=1423755 RepID=A0A0R1WMD5_9LACO|nr:tRNA pseudouridine(55) synthase TruB [Ligilactobacillus hayakitensis]KRM18817.1 trna pseudouridine synthase b [Ligilactobacillus hayakitensis DSM 18933 = JCM 14209]
MDGILPLYKERGMTSNDAVIKCRRIFKTRKIGHSGTLDPMVDGVLPICVGKATKVVNYLMDSGKIYCGSITLGFSTTTEDLEGEEVERVKLTYPFSNEAINEAMESLTGEITQIPPMYSAVKVNGRRLYEYARAGEEVKRPKRIAKIEYFKQTRETQFNEDGTQTIYFEVGCGKGTYVRTLAVDLGKKLGVPAVMSDLTRLKSGGFTIGQAKSLSQLEELLENGGLEKALYGIDHATKELPKFNLSTKQWNFVKNGGSIKINALVPEKRVNLYYDNRYRCIYQYDENKSVYKPEKMIDLS